MTNANEGDIFIDQLTNTTVTTPEYLANLFPEFGSKEIEAGTAAYEGLGLSNIQQAELILAEGTICAFVYTQCVGPQAFHSDIRMSDIFRPECSRSQRLQGQYETMIILISSMPDVLI